MKKGYLDLKEGSTLCIDQTGLELRVNSLFDNGDAIVNINGKILRWKKGKYCTGEGIGMYNFGRRGRGNRIHIRLEMPEDYRYHVESDKK